MKRGSFLAECQKLLESAVWKAQWSDELVVEGSSKGGHVGGRIVSALSFYFLLEEVLRRIRLGSIILRDDWNF